LTAGAASFGHDGEKAHAKVNLFLHVTGRRDDGYHLLDSLVVFAGVADRLTVMPGPDLHLSLAGPFGAGLREDSEDNLVLRAARRLAAEAAHPVPGAHLTLEKHLPVASGIGGGSADAAAALRLLRRFWLLGAVDASRLASSLGADVPVCLASRPARMQGIGDILLDAPLLPAMGMVLVNCGEAVSTQAVFRARAPGFREPAELPRGWSDARSLAESLSLLSNDLEAAALKFCPAIGDVLSMLRALPGCRLARMSGSGATCFGLFDNPATAKVAISEKGWPSHWWTWSGGLHQPKLSC
jgi:4-diphosphocytidyl-2-C-methyl-D-erythritol kinase